jgi:hypothetical protein
MKILTDFLGEYKVMFDKKMLKKVRIGQISIAASIIIFITIGIILGKSEESGWFGMTGMFAFSLMLVIPFIMMFIAVSFDSSFIRIENQISKKLRIDFAFIKENIEKSALKRAIWMVLGLMGIFLMLLLPAFLFGFGIVFSVFQRNLFWMILGVFTCFIVSITYITIFLTILVKNRFMRMEKLISETNFK